MTREQKLVKHALKMEKRAIIQGVQVHNGRSKDKTRKFSFKLTLHKPSLQLRGHGFGF